jgi:hypothetical protein
MMDLWEDLVLKELKAGPETFKFKEINKVMEKEEPIKVDG